ncbi:MAG: 2-C-methyl-D-erythritol 4-phosphate cytidylyltransferase [Candidatus Zixiibacteriota bacterium]
MKTYALIVAAGSSNRYGGVVPKQFRQLAGKPVLSWAISRFQEAETIDKIVVVVSEENLLYANQMVVDPYNFTKVEKLVIGGDTRRESVFKGLKSLPVSTTHVAIHDGARPLTQPEDIDRTVLLAQKERAAMLATKATDSVKRVRDGYIIGSLERDSLYLAQTPQVFQYDLIMEAHAKAPADAVITDDSSVVELLGFKVRVVEPTKPNLKITVKEDMLLAEALLKQERHE